MGTSIVNEGEVFLNDKKYLLVSQNGEPGRVARELISQFPPKQIFGDASYDNEQYISKWIFNDFTAGMLQEEYDSRLPFHSYWQSGNADHRGHFTLPDLAVSTTLPTPPTISNGDMEAWESATNLTTWVEVTGTSAGVNRVSGADAYSGYSVELSGAAGSGTASISQSFTNDSDISGRPFSITFYAKTVSGSGTSSVATLADDISSSTVTITGSSYSQFKLSRIMNVSASSMSVKFDSIPGVGAACRVYVDDVSAGSVGNTMGVSCIFNGNLYFGWGQVLFKLNTSTGNTYTIMGVFPNTITALTSSIGTCLYVFLGDSDNYWYMTSAGVWTQTDSANANLGIEWNNKLWKINTSGLIAHCATPNTASPTWTANGTVNLPANYVKSLCVGLDASGNEIIYAGTRVGLYAHDTTNALWEKTICEVPDSVNNGLGIASWQAYMWLSAGLRVLRYRAGTVAILEEAGLDKFDGLPGWADPDQYIQKFVPTQSRLYAICHQGATGGTGGIYKLPVTGGWQNHHVASTLDLHDGIVSTVYANRLWFDKDGGLYYIAEPSSNIRPGKLSSYNYAATGATAGVLVTPWFDAGSASDTKTALSISFLANNLSATETVDVYYQIDHIVNTTPGGPEAIASFWSSSLGTATTDGVTTFKFGTNGVGIAFKSIRFKFKLARGSTTTESPDLQSMTFRYMKNQAPQWAWSMVLDCREQFAGRTTTDQEKDLVTAAESRTLVTFGYRDSNRDSTTPHYVKVLPPIRSSSRTGQAIAGIYDLTVFEPWSAS